MNFVFTDGCNQDFVALCQLLDDNLNELAGGEENRKQYIQYNALKDIHDVVIAYDGNVPVGCAAFKLFADKIAEVKRVFVKKEYRGKGVAKELIVLLEKRAKEKDFSYLVLETGRALLEANALYQRLGYSLIENYGQYKGLAASVCMKKEL